MICAAGDLECSRPLVIDREAELSGLDRASDGSKFRAKKVLMSKETHIRYTLGQSNGDTTKKNCKEERKSGKHL